MADGPKRSIIAAIVALICNAYAIGVIISIPYYNWQYARENGFLRCDMER